MCHDCAHRVQDEVEVSIKEAQQECAAYEAAIKRLAEEDLQPLTEQVTAQGLCNAYHIMWYMARYDQRYTPHLSATAPVAFLSIMRNRDWCCCLSLTS